MENTIGFIGFGLIGGSIAKGIRRAHPEVRLLAYMRDREKLGQALRDGLVDEALDPFGPGLSDCGMVFLCAPVEHNSSFLGQIRPFLHGDAIVTDVGSTKTGIHREVSRLGMEDVFIGGHPMAGSEKTGFEHSSETMLENAYYLLTPTPRTTQGRLARLREVVEATKAIPLTLSSEEHDEIVAAVSHLPHLVASTLVNTVKDHDGPRQLMKQLAAGGFKDITRIASSSPEMWEQICLANAAPIRAVLSTYIDALRETLAQLEAGNRTYLKGMFEESRTYRDSITDRAKGSILPDYSFSVNIADEVGAISTLSVILAAKGISIRNIGINNNRESGEGTLLISFYDREAMDKAWTVLEQYRYELFGQ
ncbi:MAG: prephenate dehydrogenase [Lachnospiraceae bacterium]|jgi:prephenate dehydrogenase|nr:prephenate dehydrogenase [Lachnospiraceae bacterium]